MAIYLIEGPPGNGKSAYGARRIARALAKGQPVVTNIEPRPDFCDFIAKRTAGVSKKKRLRKAGEIARCMHYARDPEELFRARLHGRGEGRGLAVLDEAASWLNSRSWAAEGRGDANDWFRKHRHRGFDVLLLVQDKDMLDKHVRSLPEVVVEMRNVKRFRRFGVPVCPFNFFLAVHYWHANQTHGKRVVLRKEAFKLGWWKDLYDTHAEGETVLGEDGEDLVWLPHAKPALWVPGTTEPAELVPPAAPNPVEGEQTTAVPSDPAADLAV